MSQASNLRRRRLGFLRRRKQQETKTSMTMTEHLGELRGRLIVAAGAFLVISIIAFMFFEPITDFLLRPLCSLPRDRLGPHGCRLIFTSAMEPFTVRLKVTALTGLVLSSPVWLYQVWSFVVPGLTDKERRYALPFVASSVTFFLLGALFAYLTLPIGMRVLVRLGGENLVPYFAAAEYLNFVGLVIMVFGISFELPLILFFLGLAGVLKVEQLQRHRKGALVGIAMLAAVVTPSQDPYTMLVMAGPIYLLYEATILGLRIVKRRKAKEEAAPR